MTLPLPIIAFVVILFGYPLIQIAAIRLRRPMRLKFNALVEELLAEPAYQGQAEQTAIASMIQTSRGEPAIVLAPVMLPVTIIGLIFEFGQKRPTPSEATRNFVLSFRSFRDLPDDAALLRDKRTFSALDRAMILSLAEWPIAVAIGALASAPIAAIGLVVAGIRRWSVRLLYPREVAFRLTRVLQVLTHA